MPGKTPREAIDNYVSFLEETLSVITANKLVVIPPSKKLFRVAYREPAEIKLSNGNLMYISVAQQLTTQQLADGNYKAKTREYSYSLLDASTIAHHGVLSYHWHPNDSAVHFPHLHIRINPNVGYPELELRIHRAHYPTSRVCIEDFVLLLINYYDVRPRMGKARWTRLLEKNKRAFDKWATWKVQHPGG